MPRLRTGRALIRRTSTATVACSPARSAATVRASRLSLGRCSSSSPTVLSPSARIPLASFFAGNSREACSNDGRGQRSGACNNSSRLSACVEAKAHASGRIRAAGPALLASGGCVVLAPIAPPS